MHKVWKLTLEYLEMPEEAVIVDAKGEKPKGRRLGINHAIGDRLLHSNTAMTADEQIALAAGEMYEKVRAHPEFMMLGSMGRPEGAQA